MNFHGSNEEQRKQRDSHAVLFPSISVCQRLDLVVKAIMKCKAHVEPALAIMMRQFRPGLFVHRDDHRTIPLTASATRAVEGSRSLALIPPTYVLSAPKLPESQ